MTDWSDPISYMAIVGAATGITGTGLSVLQWLHSRRGETRPLEIRVFAATWKVDGGKREALVQVPVRILNPASIDNCVMGACLDVWGDDVDSYPALSPERRGNQGPWVAGNQLAREDALGVPVNVPARQGITGTFYFLTPEQAVRLTTTALLQLWLQDLRGGEYRADVVRMRSDD